MHSPASLCPLDWASTLSISSIEHSQHEHNNLSIFIGVQQLLALFPLPPFSMSRPTSWRSIHSLSNSSNYTEREKKAHTQDEMNSLFFFLSQSFELCVLTDTRFPSTVVSVRSHPHHSTFFFRSPAFPAFRSPLSLSRGTHKDIKLNSFHGR